MHERINSRRRRSLASVLACLSLGSLLWLVFPKITEGVVGADEEGVSNATPETEPKRGLELRLSDGSERAPEVNASAARAEGAPLDADTTAGVLERLPRLETRTDETKPFALRPGSLPAPRAGATLESPFPPAEGPGPGDATPKEPLEVLRFSPEGEVAIAPRLSITFSEPMVPIDTLASLATRDVPVRIEPEPDGAWRWIGTRTLVFEARRRDTSGEPIDASESDEKTRLPAATTYRIEIPAGTRSANGATLEKAASFTFSTPPVRVTECWPRGDSSSRDPLMALTFDQDIAPAAILEHVQVSVGRALVPVRAATAEEIASDEQVSRLIERVPPDRRVVFRARSPFAPSADVGISLLRNTPSAEGPRTTTEVQAFRFQTHGAFAITDHHCGWRRGQECPPGAPFVVELSNAIDTTSVEDALVSFEPEVAGLRVSAWGNRLNIQATTKARTRYTVTLRRELRDVFGQTLEADAKLVFETGSAVPMLTARTGTLTVLDPSAPPSLSVFSIGYDELRVRAWRVSPESWLPYLDQLRKRDQTPDAPGELVHDATVSIRGSLDELTETAVDLRSAVDEGGSQLIVRVEPTKPAEKRRPDRVMTWVSRTEIGLNALADADEMHVWASSLVDGRPLAGVAVSIPIQGLSAVTDAQGMARFELSPTRADAAAVLVAKHGDDVSMLPESASWWGARNGGWWRREERDSLRWCVFDDRGIYKPGERVRLKGWVRKLESGTAGNVALAADAVRTAQYVISDPRRNELAKGQVKINALGGFDLAFELPDDANLGTAYVRFDADARTALSGERHTHRFEVAEFRRPEFEVTSSMDEGPHLVGASANVRVEAKYYSGGPLGGAPVAWSVTTASGHYSPPGHDEFTFGTWIPWWRWHGGDDAESETLSFEGVTDGAGAHALRLDFESVNPPRPTSVTASASVTDLNQQTWSSSASLLVHPARLYVGLRSERSFVEAGEPLRIDAMVCDIDGAIVEDVRLSFLCVQVEWKQVKGEWTEIEVPVSKRSLVSAADPVSWTLRDLEGGTYRIRVQIADPEGRTNESEITRWVSGGKRPRSRTVDLESVELIPDREKFAPGDTAKLLVQPPFYPAEGLVTLRRSGLLETRRFRVEEGTYTVEVPIREEHLPNLWVQVDLVGATAREEDDGVVNPRLPKRPAHATGSINLPVSTLSRTLTVEARPLARAIEPGAKTRVDVLVRGSDGVPLADAEVALVVVDEAVLALTGYQVIDPISIFYSDRGSDVGDWRLRDHVQLARMEERFALGTDTGVSLAEDAEMAPMAAAEGAVGARMMKGEARGFGFAAGGEAAPAIALRENFDALAVFAPAAPTDEDGFARVDVELPDSLTRYRVFAVAVHGGDRFGRDEDSITARLPLMVRPSAPRFLRFGDRFELPVLVENRTDAPLEVDVALIASNLTVRGGDSDSQAGQRITVPAADRVELRFECAAAMPGTARARIAAVSGQFADAAEVVMPVWTPATTEAFATYGSIGADGRNAVVQPIATPRDVVDAFGGLDITTSSTQLQALTDAFIYILEYPYGCAEQVASRVLTIAALKDVLQAFEADGLPPPAELIAAVGRDVTKLAGLQNEDGGFGFWQRHDRSWPFISVHVSHALLRAVEKGFDVDEALLLKCLGYLAEIDSKFPADYPEACKRTIRAYALYVQSLSYAGERLANVRGSVRKLLAEAGEDGLSLEASGWALAALAGDPDSARERARLLRLIANRATETASTAEFTSSYSDGAHLILHSSRRTDGVLLDALLAESPGNDLVEKVVRGLLAHRKRGRWSNTQDNAFVLLALDRYFRVHEKDDPFFVARAWLGDGFVAETSYRGRSTDQHHVSIPMSFLTADPEKEGRDLVLSKEGRGRLYYRVGLRYAPRSLVLDPLDAGFTVTRRYEAVDDPEDVQRDGDGVWHVKLGARVRVRLEMVAPSRRYHVALVDALPAGFEAINPSLAVSEPVPEDPAGSPLGGGRGFRSWWRWTWYEHQNLRDERAEAFASLLWAGVHDYSYVARATTAGVYVVPPAKAEEMYAPETFGRSRSEQLVVE